VGRFAASPVSVAVTVTGDTGRFTGSAGLGAADGLAGRFTGCAFSAAAAGFAGRIGAALEGRPLFTCIGFPDAWAVRPFPGCAGLPPGRFPCLAPFWVF